MSSSLKLIELNAVPIEEQLKIEEALLRLTDDNYCIINDGSIPSIIMGISGKVDELVNKPLINASPIPLLKRYSGGGTVVVDHNTLFVSFIFEKKAHDFPCFPERILKWTESFYKEALQIDGFSLRENDYVIGDLKCGGNAQYIQKNRFVHHTTFLWDYDPQNMEYLLPPKKAPKYRQDRLHDEFLCRLKDFLPSKKSFISKVKETLKEKYDMKATSLNPLIPLLSTPHRKGTSNIALPI